jgi:plasmid stability protein
MTQITIRQVDDPLAEHIKKEAAATGVSMNSLLLKLLRRHFLGGTTAEDDLERNDLSRFQKGWIEDPKCEAALREFDKIDKDDWK